MADEKRDAAISYMARATDKVFAEMVLEAIEKRPRTSDTEAEQGHIVLATATLDLDHGGWGLEVIGRHDAQQYSCGFDDDATLSQFGNCKSCGHAAVSWGKHAKCSVCNSNVYCT